MGMRTTAHPTFDFFFVVVAAVPEERGHGTTAAARSVVAGGPVRRLIRMGWGTTRFALALALATLGFDSPREPDHSCAGLTGPLEDD